MKHVGLIGAGAVGSYFIWGMDAHPEIDFFLIADGKRKERLEKGVSINGKIYHPAVKAPEEVEQVDVIFVATKYSGLEGAIKSLKVAAKEDTVILSLLNGVDSEEKIIASGVNGIVVPSVMRIAAKRITEEIVFLPEMTAGVFFGGTNEREWAAVRIVQEILDMTELRYEIEEDILTDLWLKYASNIANNLPQAVLGTDASLYTDSDHGLFLATKLWNEVRAVAHAKGIQLQEEPFLFLSVPKTSKYSTLQDLEAKRHTEIDMFAGYLMELAKEFGIAVPYTEYTYHAIKALEEKNDGKIGC